MRKPRSRSAPTRPAAEVLELRQLLSGDVTLDGLDRVAVSGREFTAATATYNIPGEDVLLVDAQIDWGDGTSSTGEVAYTRWACILRVPGWVDPGIPHSGFEGRIRGTHTYATAGTYTVRTSAVARTPGQPDRLVEATSQIEVQAAAITPFSVVTGYGAAGLAFRDTIAEFRANFPGDPSQLTATIDWGDGSVPTAGTVRIHPTARTYSMIAGGPGYERFDSDPFTNYLVSGDHVYATPGTYAVTVTLSYGPDVTAAVPGTVRVFATHLFLQGGEERIAVANPTPGAVGADLRLGHFSDLSRAGTWASEADLYRVAIDWGDGSAPGVGALEFHPNPNPLFGHSGYTVHGAHAYADPGIYTATITITDEAGHSASATTTIRAIADTLDLRPTVLTGAQTIWAYGVVAGGVGTELAYSGRHEEYSVTIDWGDGTAPTPGTVARARSQINGNFLDRPAGSFEVWAGHTYSTPGTYTIRVTMTAPSGLTETVESTAEIGRLTGFVNVGAAREGEPFHGGEYGIAFFGAPGEDFLPEGFTATVDWGDGSPDEAVAIEAVTFPNEPWTASVTGPRIGAVVRGSHTFQGLGTRRVTVTITGPSGEELTLTGEIIVHDGSPWNYWQFGEGGNPVRLNAPPVIVVPHSDPAPAGTPASSSAGSGPAAPAPTIVIPARRVPLTQAQKAKAAKAAKAAKLARAWQIAALKRAATSMNPQFAATARRLLAVMRAIRS